MDYSVKQQEAASTQQRQCEVDVHNPVTNPSISIPPTESTNSLNEDSPSETASSGCPQTDAPNMNVPRKKENLDPEKIINQIGAKHQLNSKQWVAFRIIACSFIKTHLQM